MRKTLVVLAALATILGGAVAAAAAPRQSVTISLSRPSVVYGGSVTLSGKVSNHKAGETVDVLAEEFGASSFSSLGSVSTTTGGKWTDVVKPTIETAYRATWMGVTSLTVTVKVRPLITLTLINLATGRFSTKVTAGRSFAGKFVLVQRLGSTGVVTLKKVRLEAGSCRGVAVKQGMLHYCDRRTLPLPRGYGRRSPLATRQ